VTPQFYLTTDYTDTHFIIRRADGTLIARVFNEQIATKILKMLESSYEAPRALQKPTLPKKTELAKRTPRAVE
jgi:hypothetical protein